MPATFILFSSAAIGIALWVAVRRYFRNLKIKRPESELQRLRKRAAWLEQRLDLARQERQDRLMILTLSNQLGRACSDLARAQDRSHRNIPAHAR